MEYEVGKAGALEVGRVDDPAEREADRTADRVVAAIARPAPVSVDPTASAADGGSGRVRRSERTTAPRASNGSSGSRVRRSTGVLADPLAGGPLDAGTSRRIDAARSGGAPLPEVLRSPMEQTMSTSLEGVRIHTGREAAELSASISARAFTTGRDIFFGAGQFQPDSPSGQHLIAHEVAHTVQSGDTARRVVRRNLDESADVRARDREEFDREVMLLGARFDVLLGHLPSLIAFASQAAARPELFGALQGHLAPIQPMLTMLRTAAERTRAAWGTISSSSARAAVIPPAALGLFTSTLDDLPTQIDQWRLRFVTLVPGDVATPLGLQQQLLVSKSMICGHAGMAGTSAADGAERGGSPELLAQIRDARGGAGLRHVEDAPTGDVADAGRVVSSRHSVLMEKIRDPKSRANLKRVR